MSTEGKALFEGEIARRLAEFRRLRERGALCSSVTEQLSEEAADGFLNHFRIQGGYLRDAITLLAEIATLDESCLSEPGQPPSFPMLVERLSDSFDPQFCPLYDRAFAQMIGYCRRLPGAKELDATLRSFGLLEERDFLDRKARLKGHGPLADRHEQQRIRKVLLLSRVTLGADVAVTSVMLQKAKEVFPQAERILLGSSKLPQLFGGDSSLRIHEVRYESAGGLLARLQSWLPLLAAVEEEKDGLAEGEVIVIDPDSRFLQLGLLPVLGDESRYFFFGSRGLPGPGSLSRIAGDWLNATFGGEDTFSPAVWLQEKDFQFGGAVCRRLRQGGNRHLVTASFGVGGNPQKRVPDPFEEQLLLRLLESGSAVMLDKGFGEDELGRASRLVERVRAAGWKVMEMDSSFRFPQGSSRLSGCHLLTWEGEIGAFSGLIAASDEYVGYDSAGQHIAAALGIHAADIFAGPSFPVFRERWHPIGPGPGRTTVLVAPDPSEGEAAGEAFLASLLAVHAKNRARSDAGTSISSFRLATH